MKINKQVTIIGAIVILLFCLTACAKKESQPVSAKPQETKKEVKKTNDQKTTEKAETQSEQTNDTDAETVPADITVFYSNEDATAFTSENVTIEELSPEALIDILATRGAVPPDVNVVNFKKEPVDGVESLELDLNGAFGSYIRTMGTTGEYYAIGSICNTFLNAYNCQQIKITVDGQILTTGHAEYPGYMTQFQ